MLSVSNPNAFLFCQSFLPLQKLIDPTIQKSCGGAGMPMKDRVSVCENDKIVRKESGFG